MIFISFDMFSRGKCDVKYERLESGSEAKLSKKKNCASKIFFLLCLLFAFVLISFIYIQDFFKKQYFKPGDSSTGPPSAKAFGVQVEDRTGPPSAKACGVQVEDRTGPPSAKACGVQVEDRTGPPSAKAFGVQVEDRPVIKVSHLNTYVIGCYMEHRFGEKQIKTIAIVLRREQATFSCVMCCNATTVKLPAEYSIHTDHYNFAYGTATITCTVRGPCLTPTHVAITASGVTENVTSFQPIRNKDVPATFPYDFTICISVMYDYKNVLNLVQAMEMFRLLGAQRVVIYKTNCNEHTQKVLDYYEKKGFAEIIPWTITKHLKVSRGWKISESPGELQYFGQIPVLNDCVYRYMYQSHYVALQDMDELILPLNVKTWKELLPMLETKYGSEVGFEFENNQFPLTAEAHTDYKQDKWKKIEGVNILNYIDRVPNLPNTFNNYKIIVNPRLVLKATVHGLLASVNGQSTIRVDNSIARMYHFKNFTYPVDTNLIKDGRHRDYASDLIPAVSEVLQACGFIEH